jgi:D-serine deaminase-like pyridoxal phosphate-dependent protein
LRLDEIETPALILDRSTLERNLARLRSHIHLLGGSLRPHVKTAKSIDVVRRALVGEPGGITVSTLKEAEYFFGHGIRDIVYAVAIAPTKLAHVADLIRRGAALTILLDDLAAVSAASQAATSARVLIPTLIELDVDGHRSGVRPESDLLLEIGRAIAAAPGLQLRGVLTHAGESYNCRASAAIRAMADRERLGAMRGAERLRSAGFDVPTISVGSTPTAEFTESLEGVTEVRAGVYMFQDLVMAGIGVCQIDEIALSVLVSVIGHQPEKGWIITDGGWTALAAERDLPTPGVDQGYGLARSIAGEALTDDLVVRGINQEHGIIARRDGRMLNANKYPIGSMLRVLPIHACATASQHSEYHVVEGRNLDVLEMWPRINGWR